MVELNTTVLMADRLTLGELRHALRFHPLHGRAPAGDRPWAAQPAGVGPERRGTGCAAETQDPGWQRTFRQQLAAYLPDLPPKPRGSSLSSRRPCQSLDPILKLVEEQQKGKETGEEGGKRQDCNGLLLPKEQELVGWIEERVKASKGKISREAAGMLAMLMGRRSAACSTRRSTSC